VGSVERKKGQKTRDMKKRGAVKTKNEIEPKWKIGGRGPTKKNTP